MTIKNTNMLYPVNRPLGKDVKAFFAVIWKLVTKFLDVF